MKMLWLSDDYFPSRGGSRALYHNICCRVPREDVCVITRWVPGCENFDRGNPYRIVRVAAPFMKIADAMGAPECALVIPLLMNALRMLRREKFDIIHCGETVASGLAGFIASRLLSIPFIIWIHDNPCGPVSRVRYRLKRYLCLRAHGIAVSCNFAREQAIRAGVPEGRIARITPGVDTSVFTPSQRGKKIRERLGIVNKRVLLTISRLLPHKGQDMVIRVLPRLGERHPDSVYLIGGVGPCREPLERLACERGVRERVLFLGPVPQAELADYYNACDLFIMLNREVAGVSWEGCGIVFLEAGACGRPVIGGRSGGVSDSISDRETGLLVDPENEDEIVGAIDMLLDDPALAARMGRAGAERVRKYFRWDEAAASTVAFSERVVKTTRGRM